MIRYLSCGKGRRVLGKSSSGKSCRHGDFQPRIVKSTELIFHFGLPWVRPKDTSISALEWTTEINWGGGTQLRGCALWPLPAPELTCDHVTSGRVVVSTEKVCQRFVQCDGESAIGQISEAIFPQRCIPLWRHPHYTQVIQRGLNAAASGLAISFSG